MKKILLGLAILAMTQSAMAYYATPGTVVSKPIIENHGFQNVEFRELSPTLKKNYSVAAASKTIDVWGKVNSKIRIHGWHNVAMVNNGKYDRDYQYTYQLRCGKMFTSYITNIILHPGGKFSDSAESIGDVVMEEEGSWGIISNTYIASDGEGVAHPAHAKLYVTQ